MGIVFALPAAVVAGVVTVYIIAKLFSFLVRMQSSGTIETSAAEGAEGEVYLTIPAEGTGKVMVTVKNRLREYEAISMNNVEIKTGERIRVLWVKGSVLVVEKAMQ